MGPPQEISRFHRAKDRFQAGLHHVGGTLTTSKAGIIVYSVGMADGIRLIADQRMGGELIEQELIRVLAIAYLGLLGLTINEVNRYRLLFRERRLSTTPP